MAEADIVLLVRRILERRDKVYEKLYPLMKISTDVEGVKVPAQINSPSLQLRHIFLRYI